MKSLWKEALPFQVLQSKCDVVRLGEPWEHWQRDCGLESVGRKFTSDHLILTRKQELVMVGNLALWIARKKIKREKLARNRALQNVCAH